MEVELGLEVVLVLVVDWVGELEEEAEEGSEVVVVVDLELGLEVEVVLVVDLEVDSREDLHASYYIDHCLATTYHVI